VTHYLLISLHDASPAFDKQIKVLLKELKKRKIYAITFFVTPNWEGKWNIRNHPNFVQTIKKYAKTSEISLHGYTHSSDAFGTNDKRLIDRQLNKAILSFKQAFRFSPKGFIAPVWKQSKTTTAILWKRKFFYTETFFHLRYASGRQYTGLPIGMESMSNAKVFKYDKISPVITKYYSRLYARLNTAHILRFSLHPREVDNGNVEAALKLLDVLITKGWKPITYSGLEQLHNADLYMH
jgi:predicted deacetylase